MSLIKPGTPKNSSEQRLGPEELDHYIAILPKRSWLNHGYPACQWSWNIFGKHQEYQINPECDEEAPVINELNSGIRCVTVSL